MKKYSNKYWALSDRIHKYLAYRYNRKNIKSPRSFLPRKDKKILLGKRVSKTKLKLRLRNLKIYLKPFEIINDVVFCPYCGCEYTISYNMNIYPDVYEETICGRCREWLGGADNSPYYSIYETDQEEFIKKGVQYIMRPDDQDDYELSSIFNAKIIPASSKYLKEFKPPEEEFDVFEFFNI